MKLKIKILFNLKPEHHHFFSQNILMKSSKFFHFPGVSIQKTERDGG